MITIKLNHVCKMCKAPLEEWTFKSRTKHVVHRRSAWPLEEPHDYDFAEYRCPYCQHFGRGSIELHDFPDLENALLDIKEI